MHMTEAERAAAPSLEEARSTHGTQAPAKGIQIAGWITTGLFAAMMTASGIMFVLLPKPVAETFGHLGYPLYFARLLGLAKLLGVVALLAPRAGVLREWAYAGFTFVLVAAVLSHGLSGDAPGRAAPAAVTLGLLLTSYFLRRRWTRRRDHAARDRTVEAMPPLLRHSLWFSRIVLAGATILFSLIALRQIADPVGASAPHQIVLGSSDAVTITRVTGGVFLGLALVLVACLVSERRMLTGLGVLATVVAVVTAVRVVGLIVDGPGPFTLQVLKPEVVMVVLSSIAFFVERRRRKSSALLPRFESI